MGTLGSHVLRLLCIFQSLRSVSLLENVAVRASVGLAVE